MTYKHILLCGVSQYAIMMACRNFLPKLKPSTEREIKLELMRHGL